MENYELLKNCVNEIDMLIIKGVKDGNQEFITWQTKTQRCLDKIYGKESSESQDFKEINYAPFIYTYNTSDYEIIESCKEGLQYAKAILSVYLQEFQEENSECINTQSRIELLKPKVFISHSINDKEYAETLVELLEHIGLNQNDIFCSSVPGYDIPNKMNIYDYLRNEFYSKNLYVIFLLSDNYYKSPACLNEMGATWILKKEYLTILLPTFEFNKIKGAINPLDIALRLDSDEYEVKNRLYQFKNEITNLFNINNMEGVNWEKYRDLFMKKVKEIQLTISKSSFKEHSEIPISDNAISLLKKIYEGDGSVVLTHFLSSYCLCINGNETHEDNAQTTNGWKNTLFELESNKLIIKNETESGQNSKYYHITKKGVDYLNKN